MAILPSEGTRALLLNLSLQTGTLNQRQAHSLQRYVETADGVIGRQFLVPEMMRLHSLHYAIQAAFGWLNTHPHRFVLPQSEFMSLTNGLFSEWRDLVGVYFRVPGAPAESYYQHEIPERNQSLRSWLRNRYNGPYAWDIGAFFEHLVTARLFLDSVLTPEPEEEEEDNGPAGFEDEGLFAEGEGESTEGEEESQPEDQGPQTPDWDKMTTDEAAEVVGPDMRDLLERLRVGQVFCPPEAQRVTRRQLDRMAGKAEIAFAVGQHMSYPITVQISDHVQDYERGRMPLDVLELQDTYERVLSETDLSTIPATSVLDYYYDFDAGWHIRIECLEAYTLQGYEAGTLATQLYPVVDHTGAEVVEEAQDIIAEVILGNRPACTGVLGPKVLDNISGMGAFADFLWDYNSQNRDEKQRANRIARQQGWSPAPPTAGHVL